MTIEDFRPTARIYWVECSECQDLQPYDFIRFGVFDRFVGEMLDIKPRCGHCYSNKCSQITLSHDGEDEFSNL